MTKAEKNAAFAEATSSIDLVQKHLRAAQDWLESAASECKDKRMEEFFDGLYDEISNLKCEMDKGVEKWGDSLKDSGLDEPAGTLDMMPA